MAPPASTLGRHRRRRHFLSLFLYTRDALQALERLRHLFLVFLTRLFRPFDTGRESSRDERHHDLIINLSFSCIVTLSTVLIILCERPGEVDRVSSVVLLLS